MKRSLKIASKAWAFGLAAILSAALPLSASAVDGGATVANDYPTEARADYVFGCMAVNGQSRDVLSRCACSIDVIASILPYERYAEAETVLSLQLVGGERMSLFRTAASAKELVATLRRAQAEADILCF